MKKLKKLKQLRKKKTDEKEYETEGKKTETE